jgi:putative ABC transport system substrate-binding protein
VKRREFITLLGGAVAWPVAASAQQPLPMGVPSSGTRHPVIGVLGAYYDSEYGFRRGLSEMGFVEGRNVAIDYRSAGQVDRLPALAADLVSRNVATIVSIASDPATSAAIAATQTIPIVFTTAGNPVQLGFVVSLNRPGGNTTGITTFGEELLPKRLELLRELLPMASKIALLLNPNSPATSQVEIERAQLAARRFGLEIMVAGAGTENEVEPALAAAVQQRAAAILEVGGHPHMRRPYRSGGGTLRRFDRVKATRAPSRSRPWSRSPSLAAAQRVRSKSFKSSYSQNTPTAKQKPMPIKGL